MCVQAINLAQHCRKRLLSPETASTLARFVYSRLSTSLSSRNTSLVRVSTSYRQGRFTTGVSAPLGRKSSSSGGVARMTTDINALEVSPSPAVQGEDMKFGPYKIDPKEIFLYTEHCYAFVNLRPVVPDVLVTTKKLVARFTDLTAEEVTDLWLTAQRVGQKLEPIFGASSLTLAIQDGPEAGQTVPHVHVHILPRKKKDFEQNDEVYDVLDKKEDELDKLKKKEEVGHLNPDEERKDRSYEEMFEEAAKLRALFEVLR